MLDGLMEDTCRVKTKPYVPTVEGNGERRGGYSTPQTWKITFRVAGDWDNCHPHPTPSHPLHLSAPFFPPSLYLPYLAQAAPRLTWRRRRGPATCSATAPASATCSLGSSARTCSATNAGGSRSRSTPIRPSGEGVAVQLDMFFLHSFVCRYGYGGARSMEVRLELVRSP